MLEQALKLRPRSADLQYNLAIARVNMNEFGAAMKALRECLSIDPMHYHARLTRASVVEEQACSKPPPRPLSRVLCAAP